MACSSTEVLSKQGTLLIEPNSLKARGGADYYLDGSGVAKFKGQVKAWLIGNRIFDHYFQLAPDSFLSTRFQTQGQTVAMERHTLIVTKVDLQEMRSTAMLASRGSEIEFHLDISQKLIDFLAIKISPRLARTSVWLIRG